MRLTAAGRLGLGTSSPAYKFEVAGNTGAALASITQTDANGSKLILAPFNGANGAFINADWTTGNGYLALGAAGEKVRIDNSGRVGIGTTTVGARLHVNQGADSSIISYIQGSSAGIRLGTTANGAVIDGVDGTNGITSYQLLAIGGSAVRIDTGGAERARIDSSGRLLVGTSTARTNYFNAAVAPQLQVEGGASGEPIISVVRNANDVFPSHLLLGKTRGTGNVIVADGDTIGSVGFQASDGTEFVPAASISTQVDSTPGANDMPGRLVFSTTADGASSPTERMRIRNNGSILLNTTSEAVAFVNGTGMSVSSTGQTEISVDNNDPLKINRKTSDGTLVGFLQDAITEGSISVSGTTVSYNGAHLSRWSQLPGGAERTEILRGTVLSNIDEMCGWGEEDNEQLNRMKVSDVEGDKNVSGVFQSWDDDDDTYTDDFYCAMTGDFIIRVAEGVTVQRGDLLMSAGDGTAKPQDDDIVRSKTIAKVTSTHVTCTYDDGSYCVPCVLMAC
jgi:hypothetical protein